MHFQISALLATALRHAKNAYLWVIGGFLRLVFMIFVLGLGTAIASIIVRNLSGNIFWELGVFGLGGFLTLHFAMQARKFISPDE